MLKNKQIDKNRILCIYEGKLYREGLAEPKVWIVDDTLTIAYPMTDEAREKGSFLTSKEEDVEMIFIYGFTGLLFFVLGLALLSRAVSVMERAPFSAFVIGGVVLLIGSVLCLIWLIKFTRRRLKKSIKTNDDASPRS